MPVIEVLPQAKASHSTPGWAYVLESNAPDPSKTHALKTQGKRNAARSALDVLTGTHNKTASARIKTRLDELQKDGPGRAEVEVPAALTKEINQGKWKKAGDRGKQTTNVKRVLLSAKTWAHHAADEEVRQQSNHHNKDKDQVKDQIKIISHQYTGDPLLDPKIHHAPSEEMIESLLKGPALSYTASIAGPSLSNAPPRRFCAMCGYFGKAKCSVCGTYICSLSCKNNHDLTEHPHR